VPHELAPGIVRITFPLPLGIDHVHCYLLASGDAWTLVDTALALPGVPERWAEIASRYEIARIFITHFHPDHVGAAGVVAELTGADAHQGRLDWEQCIAVWGGARPRGHVAEYLSRHGMPEEEAGAIQGESDLMDSIVRFAPDPILVDDGDRIDGWEAVHLPGHADGHMCLFRDGVLIAGDALLGDITPNVGLWPESRPDPLGDYLGSLREIVRRAPRIAFPGHGGVIDDPAARAHEIIEHHEERLERAADALRDGPRNGYEVSMRLFPDALSPGLRRFALVETLAHLEYLVRRGVLVRGEGTFARA
jgi:glyoxylase-like metal-dependent hydrolase (beta-lactamase superfamily II)